MSDEKAPQLSSYLPPDRDHTQYIIDGRNGEHLGTRYWASFDDPDTLIDRNYWFVLFSPDTQRRVQAAIVANATGQQRLIWAEDIPSEQLLTSEERTQVLLSISSATVDQDIGDGDIVPVRWIRAYANADRDDQGASLVAGAFTRMLAASRIDQGIIYTAAAVYEGDEPDVHILTEEVL